MFKITDIFQKRKVILINESKLYLLILSCEFDLKKRITSEVLPSIRKNSGYIYGQENMSGDELLLRALILLIVEFYHVKVKMSN